MLQTYLGRLLETGRLAIAAADGSKAQFGEVLDGSRTWMLSSG